MRIGILFDLFTDTSDVLQFFEGVETPEQLVSKLERLKHQDTKDLLDCLIGLRASAQAMYQETFETSSSLGDLPESEPPAEGTVDPADEEVDPSALDLEIEALVADFESPASNATTENPIPAAEATAADPKTSETPPA